MRFKNKRLMALVACTALILASCHHTASESGGPVPAIEGIDWTLIELNGKPAAKGANGKPASLTLTAAGTRANGYAGCNTFFGSYTLTGSALKFGLLGMTRMACADAGALESAYTKALEATTSQRLKGGKLELLAGAVVIARFEK
jgi:heat shock protein HslJ